MADIDAQGAVVDVRTGDGRLQGRGAGKLDTVLFARQKVRLE